MTHHAIHADGGRELAFDFSDDHSVGEDYLPVGLKRIEG